LTYKVDQSLRLVTAEAQARRPQPINSRRHRRQRHAVIKSSARKMIWGTWARCRCQAERKSIERPGSSKGNPTTQTYPWVSANKPISRSIRVLLPLTVATTTDPSAAGFDSAGSWPQRCPGKQPAAVGPRWAVNPGGPLQAPPVLSDTSGMCSMVSGKNR